MLELCRYIVLNPVRAKIVSTPDEWLWSSWHCMVGKQISPDWLATNALLNYFDKKRAVAIAEYIHFIEEGVNKTIWDDLQHQIFLGDDAFVEKHQLRQELLAGDVSEIPFKQRSITVLSLKDYQIQSKTRNEAIIKAYQSGGYKMKEIGGYFKIHYSSVSRIVAASKKDRFVPLPQATLLAPRRYWKTHRHPTLIFPDGKPPHSREGKTMVMGKGSVPFYCCRACNPINYKMLSKLQNNCNINIYKELNIDINADNIILEQSQ